MERPTGNLLAQVGKNDQSPTKRYFIRTYGCQMNEHDTRAMEALLATRGYAPAARLDDADLVLFNTCTIREKAEQKAYSDIGRMRALKQARPGLTVGVCGCVAQQEQGRLLSRFPHVDLLFGPDQIGALPALLDRVAAGEGAQRALELVNDAAQYQFLDLLPWGARHAVGEDAASTSAVTAYVTIMKGCDANCAYCIVPTVRGREVCRPADEIIAQVTTLVAGGVREVTLLGQTVNTYGNRRHPGVIPFPDLLQRIAEETDVVRIRFTSPHPKDVNEGLASAYRENPKLCPHMHLPLQAGSDQVLRAMRRSYSRRHYLAKVEMLRAARPDIAITTDVIVGFPGETEADFAATLEMVEQVGYDGMYAFSYSPRPGTSAAQDLEDDVPEPVKRDRLGRLLALGDIQIHRKLVSYVGTRQEVLVEGPSDSPGMWRGRTPHNAIVHVVGDDLAPGQLRPVEITEALGHSLRGRAA